MTIDRNDPRWTAYLLGELDSTERAQFELEMAGDPTSAAVLAEVRETVELVRNGLTLEEPVLMTEEQRNSVLEGLPHATAGGNGYRFGRWSLAAGIAATVLIGFVTVRVVREVPERTGGEALSLSLPGAVGPGQDNAGDRAEVERPAATSLPNPADIQRSGSPDVDVATPAAGNEREGESLATGRADGNVGADADLFQTRPTFRDATTTQVSADEAQATEVAALPQSQESAAGQGAAAGRSLIAPAEAPSSLSGIPGGSISGVLGGVLNSIPTAAAPPPPLPAFARTAAPTAAPTTAAGAFPDQRRANFSTEEYDRITDNPFRLVSEEPLSTFSVDVDTASYANVRRFLNQRTLPPPDAVRIEEMVNYFSYDYAPPRDGRPVRINAEVASAPWAPDHRLVRIGIQGQEIERDQRAASNLVFLLDVSGSMNEPDKLPLLVDGMKLLVNQLGENDRVAIVVYAGASGLVLDSTPGFRTERILSALERLRAGGSTNGGAGIQLAYDVAVRNFIEGGVNRVILATDGDFNVGVTNNGDLTRLIEDEARTGVFLSVLGFGTGNYNDAGLEALADRGNGNYAYIDSIREARKVLVEEIGGTLVTIAKDVKFQVEFNPSEVNAYRLIGYENRALENQDFNDDTVDAGEIGAGHTVTALFEIVPRGVEFTVPGVDPLRYQTPLARTAASESGELLTVKVRYKEPDGDESLLIESPVIDREQTFEGASEDFRFAAAVAGFGMILRDSPYRGDAGFDSVLRIADRSRGSDEGEYRREFVELVRRARALDDLGR